jgi:hypothetical protein
LAAFTASFTVFCHCATASKHSCCCEKKTKSCNSAQAVKFNLAEKQLADPIHAAPSPVMELFILRPLAQPTPVVPPFAPVNINHPPPDLLTLQHRLLI